MARSEAVCVSCASLPSKDRGAAVKTVVCADCKASIGVTSYGATFRFTPQKSRMMLSPMVFGGLLVGTGAFVATLLMVGLGMWGSEQISPPSVPVAETPLPALLAGVPEVGVDDALPANSNPRKSKQHIQQLIDRIRGHNNGANKDAFVLANMDARRELRGLPFVMGAECRLSDEKSRSFQTSVQAVRDGLDANHRRGGAHDAEESAFWNTYHAGTGGNGIGTDHGIAALTQILGPEREKLRTGLVRNLSQSKLPEASRALARSAIFDPAPDVRFAALRALKNRPVEESAEVFMHGMRYPLAIFAKRSAQAMIELQRGDMLPQLVAFLGESAPGDPAEQAHEDRSVSVVREVVRVNHHRNCLLCHPPSATGALAEVPGVIPIPGESFPESPKDAYGSAQSQGDPMVRADTTYLRQDFSALMQVENAAPWPSKQRFDFLVRTRVVEGKELLALTQRVAARPAGFVSDHHRAAIRVLEALTGQENVAPTQVAWQRVIGDR